jgi:hypothetical protein
MYALNGSLRASKSEDNGLSTADQPHVHEMHDTYVGHSSIVSRCAWFSYIHELLWFFRFIHCRNPTFLGFMCMAIDYSATDLCVSSCYNMVSSRSGSPFQGRSFGNRAPLKLQVDNQTRHPSFVPLRWMKSGTTGLISVVGDIKSGVR